MADNGDIGTSVDAPQKKGRKGGRQNGPPAPAGAEGEAMSKLTDQLMGNPAFMDALKAQLGGQLGGAGDKAEFYRSLPKQCKKRVGALKNIQLENQELECRFHKELHELECKFESQFLALCDRRKAIVAGEYEPTEEECDFSLAEDDDEDEEGEGEKEEEKKEEGEKNGANGDADKLADSVAAKVSLKDSEYDESTKGLPQFWLTALQNVNSMEGMIEEQDVPILKHLQDVTCTLQLEPVGFILNFHFAENEFFTNRVLTKKYLMKIEVDREDPWNFDGSEIFKCEGCTIDWVKGKDVTVKTIKKKQKNKKGGQVRTITKQVKAESFFNFFNPPQLPEDGDEEVSEEVAQELAQDFELGLFMKETFVPKAVLYFTGEADELDEEDEEEYEDDDDAEADYDEENDPDYKPAEGEQPQECKQQ